MSSRASPDTKRTRINERFIKSLPAPERGNYIAYDPELPGFGIRVTAGNARTFVLNYRCNGRERRMSLGRWPTWNASAARARAVELRRMIDTGIDPLGLKEQRRGAPTVKEIVSSYLARHAVHKKTGAEDKRCLERDVLPSWGSRKASDISKRDVLELIEKKSKTAPAGANALLTLIKIVFNWAIRVDLLQINPAAAVRPPTKQVTRDRTLSDKEISTFWRGLDNAPISPVVRAALRFILTTAQRPGEVAGMSWNEVDDDVWTIPSGRHKAGRQHVLPLSSLAIELIESLPRTSPFVFASPRRNSKPITRMSLSTALYLNRKAIGLSEPATPHDLRRTAATLLPADRFVKRLVLGHADREVTATYDRLSYLSEKRSGLEAWASKLREIIAA